MGVLLSDAHVYARLAAEKGLGGRCLSFGKQLVFFDLETHIQLMLEHGHFALDGEALDCRHAHNETRLNEMLDSGAFRTDMQRAPNSDWIPTDWIRDEFFFLSTGAASFESLDATDYEGCDFVHDLNVAPVPTELQGRFDSVLDFGTIEHVFHLPNFLRNLWELLKPGGLVFMVAPSNNHVDHGFYQLSPTFFADWFAANGWTLEELRFVGREDDWLNSPGFARSDVYHPALLRPETAAAAHPGFGGLDARIYATIVCARKTESARWDVIPQQSVYARLWDEAAGPSS